MVNQQIVFSIIENLHLEKNTTFSLLNWTITNDLELIKKNIPNAEVLIEVSGLINFNSLFQKTVAFQLWDFNGNTAPANFIHLVSGQLNCILSRIWLEMDNSIFTAIQISQDFNTSYTQNNRRNDFISNSSGNYELTYFTDDIVKKIVGIDFEKFIELFFHVSEKKETDEINSINAHRANLENNFTKFTRIQRSFLILNIARTTSFLPMKIAFYINVLECLLLNDNAELNFKLQLYTANFIGKNIEDKVLIRDTINTSYDIRSKFFHGSNVKQNLLELQNISKQLDDIIRRTLLQAVNISDIINSKDTSVLNKYMKSIMFS